MVFEPNAAPTSHAQFMEWYEQQTQWAEGHSYDDPAISTAKLRAWFVEIIQSFPPLNGPLSKDDLPDDEASATDYSVRKSIIYCAFAWSKAEPAYGAVFELAQKHGLGFFDVSSGNEEVWLPSRDKLNLAHAKELPEKEVPRWVQVPMGLVLASLTLLCGYASIVLLVVPNDKSPSPILSVVVGLTLLLGCVWVFEKCFRLLTGRKNQGGLMAPKTLRVVSFIFLALPVAGLFTGYYWKMGPIALFQAVMNVLGFLGLRALARKREANGEANEQTKA